MVNVIEQDVEKADKFARAVVAKRVAIVSAVVIALNLLVSFHVITPDANHVAVGWVNTVLDAVAALVAIPWVQKDVTPVSDPRTNSGEKLVPQSAVENAVQHALDLTNRSVAIASDPEVAKRSAASVTDAQDAEEKAEQPEQAPQVEQQPAKVEHAVEKHSEPHVVVPVAPQK